MSRVRGLYLGLGLVTGILVGVIASALWPHTPVYAVATHGADNFAMLTAAMDGDVEGVFILDSLTGDLKCAVLAPLSAQFNSLFESNIAKDFPASKNPKYLMVSGNADLRPQAAGGNFQPTRGVVYVAELTSGVINAYGILWSPAMQQSGRPQKSAFTKLNTWKFRNVAIRPNAP